MTVDMYYFSLYEKYQEKYNHLKQKFIEIASLHINATNLQVLIQFYDSAINSKRASDSIKDLRELIKILEKRLVLSYKHIEPLKYIESALIKDPVLSIAIKEYELQLQNYQQLPPLNIYKCKSGEYLSQSDERNVIVVINLNPSEKSANDSEESHLLCFNARHDQSRPPAEASFDRINSNQITNSLLPSSNVIIHRFMNISNIININNFYILRNNIKKTCCKSTWAVMVLVVILCFVFIKFDLKSSVSAIPSIPSSSSSTSTRDNSEFLDDSQTIFLNNITTLQHQPSYQESRDSERSSQPSALQIQVFQYLSENLGRNWRDLARFLDVKEAEIDSIDLKTHYDYKSRTLEALEIFRKRCDPCSWKKKLIKSLEIVRRKDLAEHVTEMILQSGNN